MVAPNENHQTPVEPRVVLGRCCATPGALDALTDARMDAADLLRRHSLGDWGTVCDEDRRANDEALRQGERVISAYVLGTGVEVWVITEADRSATTITLPEEY